MRLILGLICVLVLLITLNGFHDNTKPYIIPKITPTIPLNYCNPFTLEEQLPLSFHIKHIDPPDLYENIPYKYYLVIEWDEGSEIYTVDTPYCNNNECKMQLTLDSNYHYDMIIHIEDNLTINMRIPECSIPSIDLQKCIETNSKVILRMMH